MFLLAHSDSWLHERYMKIYKMGEGPIYTFYRPYHLSPLETPLTVARAVLFNDATITPKGAPVTDVSAIAKFDLKAGDTLDGVGGSGGAHGVMENSPVARAEDPPADGLDRWLCAQARPRPGHSDHLRRRRAAGGSIVRPAWREQLAAF